jgi:tetratricopeptide (TPR) repeat protein
VGDIHEQLSRTDGKPMDGLFAVTDIRLNHMGYLDSVVSRKNKRERNIPLLIKELEKKPDNAFMLFNLGNEYMAKKEYTKALEWYFKAREHYKVQEAFGPHLLFRIALCHYNLNRYAMAVKALAEGLSVYPGCTDMEYLRGRVYMDWHRDFLADESFQKAITMGQPHATLRFSDDCATTKPLMSLAELHMRQHDYANAAAYYTKAIQADNNMHAAIYGMAKAYRELGYTPEEIEAGITALFLNLDHTPNRLLMVDVLINQGLWELCQKHLFMLDEAEESFTGEVALLWGKYYLRAGEIEKALEHLRKAVRCIKPSRVLIGAVKESVILLFVLLLIQAPGWTEDMDEAIQAVGQAFGHLGDLLSRQVLIVLTGGQVNLLQGEEPGELMVLLAAILKAVLECGAFDLFEKTLYVYNYIDNPKVLLSLANLYLECGLTHMAGQTVLRSVKELNIIDEIGAHVLLESLLQAKAIGSNI